MHTNAFLRWMLQPWIALKLLLYLLLRFMSVLLFHVCRCSALQPFRTVHTRAWVALPPVISLQRWTHGPRLRWWELFAESSSIYSNSTIKPTLSALAAVETALFSQPAPRPTPPPSLRIFGSGITNPKAAENRSSSPPSVFFFLGFFFYDGLEKASAKPPKCYRKSPVSHQKGNNFDKRKYIFQSELSDDYI